MASTSKGKYYIRVDDDCKPVLPDELDRLFTDRGAFMWETQTHQRILYNNYDQEKISQFLADVKASDRISDFIKEKSEKELLEYYFFIDKDYLTNLGILWISKREHRVRLQYSPSIQFIKYDENDQKVNKLLWDDYSKNPKDLFIL